MTHDGSVILDRRAAVGGGEICLRLTDDHYEVISNGTFLMDTRSGVSERLLIRAAVARLTSRERVLIGGLGVGFSLGEALACDFQKVVVAELEPGVVEWHGSWLGGVAGHGLDDPRVQLEVGDLEDVLRRSPKRSFDLVAVDVDNGPDWLVRPENAHLYSASGLSLMLECLRPDGILSIWSASVNSEFERSLRCLFPDVWSVTVPVPVGPPDVVYLARASNPGGPR